MNTSDITPSKWITYPTIIFFILLGFGSFIIASTSFISLVSEIKLHNDLISINKGLFYLFGVGIGSVVLVIDGVYTSMLNKKLPNNLYRLLTRIGILSIAIIIVLPHLIHYLAANHLENEGYQICESRSTQWLFVRTIVYTKTLPCDEK